MIASPMPGVATVSCRRALAAALLVALGPAATGSARLRAATPSARAGRQAAASSSALAQRAALSPPRALAGSCLLEESTGQVLYTFAAERRLAIASTTKLMTALVVLRHVRDLNRVLTQNDYYAAPGDSQIGLFPGARVSVRDLLIALMLPSADDAAEDLAYNLGGGSIRRFVGMMNAQARALGLAHTHYATPSGLDTPGNYSTPCDLLKLARYDMLKLPFLRHAVDMKSATIGIDGHPLRVLNLNSDLWTYPWINGIKTGHTADAGYVLVVSGTQHAITLIGDVLDTPSEAARESEGAQLLQWGFAHFRLARPVRAGSVVARLPVNDRPGYRAAVIAGGSFERVIPRGARLRTKLSLPRSLSGPLPRHARVGSLVVSLAGRRLGTVALLLARRLPAVSVLTKAARVLTRGTTLLGLGAAICALLAFFAVRRRRPRAREGHQA
jgi:D-alanyl-D-alanine carboxypeptidase (penicillin-binding protein 5/6)